MNGTAQHQRAVARSLGFAQQAAGRRDFDDALAWLWVVETVDGGLPEPTARAATTRWGNRRAPVTALDELTRSWQSCSVSARRLARPSAGSICRFVPKQRGPGLAKRIDLW